MLQASSSQQPLSNTMKAKGFRPGKFRLQLLDEVFLQTHADEILTKFSIYFEIWKQGHISDPEICALYILLFSAFRRPRDWWSGVNSTHAGLTIPSSVSLKEFCHGLSPTQRRPKGFADDVSILTFFCRSHLRSIPEAAHHSIKNWAQGNYSLKLSTTVPSPREVLLMQTQGERCVSLLVQPSEMTTHLEGHRDPLGFLVHDLIHAHHFFSQEEKARQQIGFYRWILHLYENKMFTPLLEKNEGFKKDFEYITSDMNSHCLHLMMTLRAKIDEAFEYAEEGQKFFVHLIQQSLMPLDLQAICEKINTPQFRRQEDGFTLEQFFASLQK